MHGLIKQKAGLQPGFFITCSELKNPQKYSFAPNGDDTPS
jgi:hypothetical protein